jgi:alpha-amylase/alpha-mannosidase (GH57 family)
MERYICIHGHFYQPPRENPWLEDIELQDSAYPYHDWNERIGAECYAPNGASRILDGEGRITKIPNNYSKISFNFGPTLLAWMADKDPDTYRAVLQADQISQQHFSGHGSALAQVYNHMILPLANRRDKQTQIRWGLQDFRHRFGRAAEGMWLAETAVDLETLEIMAEEGLRFTILAPRQAARVRPLGDQHWDDVSGERIDPTRPYLQRLPSGRSITLFFYDGPISRGVAFEGVLEQGENLAHRLVGAFSEGRTWPQLVHIATDGETFGHHHTHGEMALSYALNYIETQNLAKLTNYGEYLERHIPDQEVEIFDNSSWSCIHGVERWWRDCGCNSGMHPGWNQAWRTPLRNALDWLRDALVPLYEEKARALLRDPWTARDSYVGVILNRSSENLQNFLGEQALRPLRLEETIQLLRLLEMQRHAMLMYTSCGWFFDELSGLETVQVIQYAGRALQLAAGFIGPEIEEEFIGHLENAKSNLPEHRDGRHIYEALVRPARLELLEVGAHYAVSSLFESYESQNRIYAYGVAREDYHFQEAGKAKLGIGRIRIASEITQNTDRISFAVLHFGDHNIAGGVRSFQGEGPYGEMVREITETFGRADFPETLRGIDRHFGEATYSLRSLFRDEQRKVLNQILEDTLADIGATYRQIYIYHGPLMRFLIDLGAPLPNAYRATAELVLNVNLKSVLDSEDPDMNAVIAMINEAKTLQVTLDYTGLEYGLRLKIIRLARDFQADPAQLQGLVRLDEAIGQARLLPFQVNLWKVQNLFYDAIHTVYPEWRWKAEQGRKKARTWVNYFREIGEKLSLRVD